MECAGNGRRAIYPPASGVPWGDGAVGTARWTGTPLAGLLAPLGRLEAAVEVVLEGADQGREPGAPAPLRYAMSLPIAKAMDRDTLVAWEMNGRALLPEHGAPLRAIVPGYYGMASVKWLSRIRVVTRPFDGYFRKDAYAVVAEGDPPGRPGRPVTALRIRSLITSPKAGANLPLGLARIRGFAWSGDGQLDRVEVGLGDPSPDGSGAGWQPATLGKAVGRYAWTPWSVEIGLDRPGQFVVRARAFDTKGRSQPLRPAWNLRGVEANGVHGVPIVVGPGRRPTRDSRQVGR